MEDKYKRMLYWRNIQIDIGDTPCKACGGSGSTVYGSTSTWRGGIGGQAMTADVCDKCWGSGNPDKPWANLRKIRAEKQALTDEAARLRGELKSTFDMLNKYRGELAIELGVHWEIEMDEHLQRLNQLLNTKGPVDKP